ncbi:MAG: xanthine dehydrogenase family protein molybdopterin-binding subunit [Candidatus Dormibacteraceae bacterium]
MAILGTPRRRVEGAAKVTGATRYGADLRVPGLVHVRLVLSQFAHARLNSIETAAARRAPGVLAVVTGHDLPPLEVPGPDLPLAREEVFYAGQPIAAVIAESDLAAADGAALVEVHYQPLPAVTDVHAAMGWDAPRVLDALASHAEEDAGLHGAVTGAEVTGEDLPPNVTSKVRFRRGDAAAALAGADVVVEGTYLIPSVHQGFLEPHVAIARPEPEGGFTIWTSTQDVFGVRETVADQLKIPHGEVRVVQMPVGGGFGGKFFLLEALVALLAGCVGRPVRLELTRAEEFAMGRGGPGAVIELRLGAARDGSLAGLVASVIDDNGACAGDCAGSICFLMGSTYRLPAFELTGVEVASHKPPTTAYRAPGGPQAFFALESAMGELAERLGADPVELRLRHALREGDLDARGDPRPRIGLVECLEAARDHPLHTATRGPEEGLGVAAGGWGGGSQAAAAGCRLESDGTLTLQLGSVDITGTDTTLAMIAAEAFGISPEKVRVEKGDSGSAPFAGGAGGSKITYTVGPAAERAAADARRQVLEVAAEELEAAAEDLVLADGRVSVRGVPGRGLELGALARLTTQFGSRHAPVHGFGRTAVHRPSPMYTVHLCRVRVDAETGEYALTGYAAIQDVGRALNPPEVEAQVQGGATQGVGRAIGEELAYDADGGLLTGSFLTYGLPTIDQVPEIAVRLVEIPSPHGPGGAKGVGEPPAVPGAAAVANAIADASGVRVRELPIDPSRLVGRDSASQEAARAAKCDSNLGAGSANVDHDPPSPWTVPARTTKNCPPATLATRTVGEFPPPITPWSRMST